MTKTVAQKLFIKPGYRVAILHAPENYLPDILRDMPDDVTLLEEINGEFDLIQCFVTTKEALIEDIATLRNAMKADANIWVCYPKGGKKAKIKTDLNRDILHEAILAQNLHLKATRQISIDDTWSALRYRIDD